MLATNWTVSDVWAKGITFKNNEDKYLTVGIVYEMKIGILSVKADGPIKEGDNAILIHSNPVGSSGNLDIRCVIVY
jgi:hypothetical protein